MANIRAKFICESVTDFGKEAAERVTLRAIHGKGNESWSKWTPGGSLELSISNPEARGKFVPKQAYYLDFSDAPQTEPGE